jgi:hypothetical protein
LEIKYPITGGNANVLYHHNGAAQGADRSEDCVVGGGGEQAPVESVDGDRITTQEHLRPVLPVLPVLITRSQRMQAWPFCLAAR